jgi:hypothetical protein
MPRSALRRDSRMVRPPPETAPTLVREARPTGILDRSGVVVSLIDGQVTWMEVFVSTLPWPAIISSVSALLGVAVGGFLTAPRRRMSRDPGDTKVVNQRGCVHLPMRRYATTARRSRGVASMEYGEGRFARSSFAAGASPVPGPGTPGKRRDLNPGQPLVDLTLRGLSFVVKTFCYRP